MIVIAANLKMVYRSISDELQKIAVEQLHENPARIEENLQHFREWLQKQPHLKIKAEDQILLSFLRGCKWSLQRAKEKLDYFYTVRTLLPEFFNNRDPQCEDIQSLLQRGVCTVLPKTENTDGPRICVLDFSRVDHKEISPISLIKLCFMIWDILLNEDDNFIISGVKLLSDFSHTPISYLLQFTPDTIKKFIMCGQNAYPARIKKSVGVHISSAMEAMYNNLCKPFLSKKIANRVVIYSSTNAVKLNTHISQSFLPEKFGGTNGSSQELTEYWKTKIESYREWFIEDRKNICDESLRPGKPKLYNEEFNMEGTFRKLTVD